MKALILLSSLGVIALLAEIFNFKKVLHPFVLLSIAAIFILNTMDWDTNQLHFNMMRFDNFAVAFTSVILFVAFLWFLMAQQFFKEETSKTDHYALAIFSITGAVIMTSYTNMAMLFLGIEILSIPMYVLAGSRKEDALSNEAAFKYLIMGAFATGFLLFGIVLIYGATGSFDLSEITSKITENGSAIPSLFYTGVLLMLVGLSFKVSAVPFHFWVPDVYQGSPTPVTAYMSTIVKMAAFAAFLRLFNTTFSSVGNVWHNIVWVLVALTLLTGNITAVVQSSSKRLLAYSSVAHAGYILLGLLAGNSFTNNAILIYVLAYSIASLATFCIISVIESAKNTDALEAFNGLGKSNPFIAFAMTVALLSLAGIPPTVGFFAKYYIFTAAFHAGNVGLVLIAIIASLIGVYYYFRIIISMYFKEGSHDKINLDTAKFVLLIIAIIAIILLGLFPDYLVTLL